MTHVTNLICSKKLSTLLGQCTARWHPTLINVAGCAAQPGGVDLAQHNTLPTYRHYQEQNNTTGGQPRPSLAAHLEVRRQHLHNPAITTDLSVCFLSSILTFYTEIGKILSEHNLQIFFQQMSNPAFKCLIWWERWIMDQYFVKILLTLLQSITSDTVEN